MQRKGVGKSMLTRNDVLLPRGQVSQGQIIPLDNLRWCMNKHSKHFNSCTFILMRNRKRISIAHQTRCSMAISALGEANIGV